MGRARVGYCGVRQRATRGFSLIELMVAVAVVAILAAVAIPSYSAYVIRGKRSEAKTALLQAAQYLERNYSQAGCYAYTDAASCTAGNPIGTGTATPNPANTVNDYSITAVIASQTYTVSATPCGSAPAVACTTGSTFTDADCGVLTLDHTGAKTAAGSNAATMLQQCWQK